MIKKMSTLKALMLCVVLMLFANAIASARVSKECTYTSKNGNKYSYQWHVDENGNKWTTWTMNGDKQDNYNGWIEPGPGPGVLPDNPQDSTGNIDKYISASLSLAGDKMLYYQLIMPVDTIGTGESDDNINVEIIDVLSGNVVKELTFLTETFIDVSDLPNNRTYLIVSANNTGMIHRIAFILTEEQLYIGSNE